MTSLKLSITVRGALEAKYTPAALKRIDTALARWIAADRARGIETHHVAVDDDAAVRRLGGTPIRGRVTAAAVKRCLDSLARRLDPAYIVLVGGHDVVPAFVVPNPSFDADNGDVDRTVATDNPYACSKAFSARSMRSYLVPDRVLGRLSDLPAYAGATVDPAPLLAALATATRWKPRPRRDYAQAYATCCHEWQAAGEATMRHLELPMDALMISPPTVDATPAARSRLARRLHITKCHGVNADGRFFGQRGASYPAVLSSDTLRTRVRAGTLAAAMCCYGAAVHSPDDPAVRPRGAWPIALAYLLRGAPAFMGATRVAWVGQDQMLCADWIVAGYLKKALAGASLGRALLESKQDYLQFLQNQGLQPDTADEKTLIEFVLLGDPSVHPVAQRSPAAAVRATRGAGTAGPVAAAAEALRAERRAARRAVAAQVQRALPQRTGADAPRAAQARAVFAAAAAVLGKAALRGLDPATAHCSRLQAAARPASPAKARAVGRASAAVPTRAAARGETTEYTWSRRRTTGGVMRIVMLKVHADAQGHVLTTRVLHSA